VDFWAEIADAAADDRASRHKVLVNGGLRLKATFDEKGVGK
jgi:hypothetical protein